MFVWSLFLQLNATSHMPDRFLLTAGSDTEHVIRDLVPTDFDKWGCLAHADMGHAPQPE